MNCCPGGTGSPPICPAGFTVFCAWIALMISGTVMPRLASLSGLTQIRMAYWPAPKTVTDATPGMRVNASFMLMIRVIGQKNVVVSSVGD